MHLQKSFIILTFRMTLTRVAQRDLWHPFCTILQTSTLTPDTPLKFLLLNYIVLMALSVGLTLAPEGLSVGQYPPSLTVMRGETATLCCHFRVNSLKYGVQWFKMKPGKQLVPKSSRQIFVEKNQSSSLVITQVTPEDSGWYYCEVNVLQKDPERGNGTELFVLGEKQIGGLRNEHPCNLLGVSGFWICCHAGNYVSFVPSVYLSHSVSVWSMHHRETNSRAQSIKIQVVKFPLSSSFCLSSFMTDLEIITPARFAVPCIDLAQGIETHQKTRQGGMAKLLCGNPSCGRKAFFWFPLNAMLLTPDPNIL